MPMQNFLIFGLTGGMGRVPMQNLLFLAELKALGVCPCRIFLLWQNWRQWVCAPAEFDCFGRTGGVGHVPMQNFFSLAEHQAFGVCLCRVFFFGRTGGIGRVPMQTKSVSFLQNEQPCLAPQPPPPPQIGGRIRPTSPICSAD